MEEKTKEITPEMVQIMSNNSKCNVINEKRMYVGRYDCENIFRVLVRFPLELICKDVEVLEAKLKVNVITPRSFEPDVFTVYAISENWDINSVNWRNQPRFDSSVSSNGICIDKTCNYSFDITPIVIRWCNEKMNNYGMMLKNNENMDYTMFHSENKCLHSVSIIYDMKCKHEAVCTKFIGEEQVLLTTNCCTFSSIKDTSLTKAVTFFITNMGTHPVTVNAQISPDGNNFINESFIVTVQRGETVTIVPYCFAHYTRLVIKNINSDYHSKVKIWYQAQQ